MAVGGDESTRKLDQTSAWAVGKIILAVGTKLQVQAIITWMALEIQERDAVVQGIPLVQVSDKHFWFSRPQNFKLIAWFIRKEKKALTEALQKIKEELMFLGFISLILAFSQVYIGKICIPLKTADTMLPCSLKGYDKPEEHRRLLSGESTAPTCKERYESLISTSGIHELHIFIFFLAVFHVFFSAMMMTLGRLKIRGWKQWERDVIPKI